MPGWIGPWEILLLLVVVLLVFGPKRLPELGRSLGKGMREFKDSLSGDHDDDDDGLDVTDVEDAPKPLATTAATAPASPADAPQKRPESDDS